MKTVCLFQKVGTFRTPDWRYELIALLDRKLAFLHRSNVHKLHKDYMRGKYLRRFLTEDDLEHCVVNLKLPPLLVELEPQLTNLKVRCKLHSLLRDYLGEAALPELLQPETRLPRQNMDWRLNELESVKDEYVQKLIKFYACYEHDEGIDFAIKIRNSSKHEEFFRHLGYVMYLGKSDVEIATKWKLKRKQVAAFRHLFFDFTCVPKDPIANAAYFRQFIKNSKYNETDFSFFKLISELGEVGLKAISNFQSLNDEERKKIEIYLGSTMLENVMNLKFSVRDSESAYRYNTVIGSLGSYYIKKEEVNVMRAKVAHLSASTNKLQSDMLLQDDTDANTDVVLLEAKNQLRIHSLEDVQQPDFLDISQLK